MENKICPFNMKPCMKGKCMFFDDELGKCQFKGQADYIVDYLVEIRDAVNEVGGLTDD